MGIFGCEPGGCAGVAQSRSLVSHLDHPAKRPLWVQCQYHWAGESVHVRIARSRSVNLHQEYSDSDSDSSARAPPRASADKEETCFTSFSCVFAMFLVSSRFGWVPCRPAAHRQPFALHCFVTSIRRRPRPGSHFLSVHHQPVFYQSSHPSPFPFLLCFCGPVSLARRLIPRTIIVRPNQQKKTTHKAISLSLEPHEPRLLCSLKLPILAVSQSHLELAS